MNRRVAGALLVLLTIVGAAVVSTVAGRRVIGSAIAVVLPGPPAVGDCLLLPSDVDSHSPARPPGPPFGPCPPVGAGAIPSSLGEVVAVRIGVAADRATGSDDGCRSAALEYSGLHPRGGAFLVPGAPIDDPVDWDYSVDVRTTWVAQLPALPQSSAWAACVARPPAGFSGPGRLADAFGHGSLPGAYGTCWQSPDLTAAVRMVHCDQAHVAELIAVGRVVGDEPLDRPQVLESCRVQAAIVLRRADPTLGGELTIRVHPDRQPDARIRMSPTCFVTATDDRRIIGSLVGLGSATVRFAG